MKASAEKGSRLVMSTLRWHSEPMVLRIANAVARYIGFSSDDIPLASHVSASEQTQESTLESPQPTLRLVTAPAVEEQHPSHKWRRHPQLRAYEAPITSEERDGRQEAVRGFFAAREGALEVATRHFTRAAQCYDVDITDVPGFWSLTRGQMQSAVDAYEAVGRFRDSAALDAQISTIFRPSLVGASQQPIVPTRPQHKAASN